jgi:hypothetical protein
MGYMERLKQAMRMRGWGLLLADRGWQHGILLRPVSARIAPDAFSVETTKGLLRGEKGDAIVRFPNGDITVIDKATWPLIQVHSTLAPAEEPGMNVQAHTRKVID